MNQVTEKEQFLSVFPVGYSKGKASWTAVTEGTPGQLIILSRHTSTLQAKCAGHLEARTPATGQAGPAELCCSGLLTSHGTWWLQKTLPQKLGAGIPGPFFQLLTVL